MKRILLILALMLNAVIASSQTITRVETLKSLNFGCQKFCALITNDDTTFVIKVKQAYGRDDFVIGLGNREEAIKTLQFLVDVKLNRDDLVNLENPTGNYVKKGFGGLTFISQGHQYNVTIGKSYLKGFLNILMGVKEDGEDEDDE
jgi:hypothetical protein